jgi:hypothetical protein
MLAQRGFTKNIPELMKIINKKYPGQSWRMHGHHIVMKESKFASATEARQLLKDFGVPTHAKKKQLKKATTPDEIPNMCMAVNGHDGIHSQEYADAVLKRLNDAKDKATKRMRDAKVKDEAKIKEAVGLELRAELQKMGEIIEKGKKFW